MATLKELREKTTKSRAKVAADMEMSERHLYRLETGASPVRRIVAVAFASYYGVGLDDIDGWERDAA